VFKVPPEKLDVNGELRDSLAREVERKGSLIFEPLPFLSGAWFLWRRRTVAVTGHSAFLASWAHGL
jgi:hypothetical protein